MQRATQAKGPTHAKRVEGNAELNVTWYVTPKLRLVDSFTFYQFKIPGYWNLATVSLYAQAPLISGAPSLLLPPAIFDATNCPPPYSASTCPQHNDTSGPDTTNGTWTRYLSQRYISNTLQLEYDFTSKIGGRLGFLYGNRKVASQDFLTLANEVFFPGGPGGTPANFFNAARGDCADPTACTAQPDGSLVFSGSTGNPTVVSDADINSYSMLMGIWARPTSNLRLSYDMDLWWADSSFVRPDPRQLQRYRFQASYSPTRWMSLDTSFDILNHRNNVDLVNDIEHDRTFSFTAVLTPNERFSFDLGYTYNNTYFQLIECWAYGSGIAPPVPPGTLPPGAITTPCPVPADLQGGDVTPFGGPATYKSTTNFGYADILWKPVKRLTLKVGYSGAFGNGNTIYLNPLAPVGPLQYAYQRPYAGFALDLWKGNQL